MKQRRTIVIAGPTASGKSALALTLAERLGGRVINADSMQLYTGLEIVTARPRGNDLQRAPHRLYGVLDPGDRCTAGRWRDMALQEMRTGDNEGRPSILVGGSGLYLHALMEGFHPLPPVPPHIRSSLKQRLVNEGAPQLHAELQAGDPHSARRIRPGDGQRIVRALEVLTHTGKGLAHWYDGTVRLTDPERAFVTIVIMPSRPEIHAASDGRFLAMLEAGAIGEVERFRRAPPGPDCPLWKAVGVAPICRHLDGELSEREMIALAQRDTRRYAKRQSTWFRNRVSADLVCNTRQTAESGEEVLARIAGFL